MAGVGTVGHIELYVSNPNRSVEFWGWLLESMGYELAFHGGSAEWIDELRRELLRRGVALLYDDRYPHAGGTESYAVFFEDPDRLKVEVVV